MPGSNGTEGKKNKLYSYENARLLGAIIFISLVFIFDICLTGYDYFYGYNKSLYQLIEGIQDDIYIVLILILPFAFIVTILAMISNLKLMKKEGKGWKNMLGIILGGFICLSTISVIIGKALTFSTNAFEVTITDYFFNAIVMFIIYLECILVGNCILGIKAAKNIPKFDKDCIIILGCRVKKDGDLSNLLKGRVDRAIEFSQMQKQETGKEIIFVPSGGKGDDEPISEAQAMKNYLIKKGINEDSILIEDKSINTYENIKLSNSLIESKIKNAKTAFATTNYHVFRTMIIANNQNLNIEGIGAKTKTYFWVNAFIREYVATLVSEKKKNIRMMIIIMLGVLFFSIFSYISML